MHPEDEEYVESIEYHPYLGNCKRCIHRSSCGNKNKREADWCDKYRPEMKRRRKR